MKNVIENKKEKTWTVQMPNGKTKTYKTLRGAEACAARNNIRIIMPEIVTANVWQRRPSGSASGRRSAERRRNAEIQAFCRIFEAIPTLEAEGVYQETCTHIEKHMAYRVYKDDVLKNTNLTGFINEAARWGIELVK